jgi:hypothetical protein
MHIPGAGFAAASRRTGAILGTAEAKAAERGRLSPARKGGGLAEAWAVECGLVRGRVKG